MLRIIEDRKKEQANRFELVRSYIKRLSTRTGKVTCILYGSTVRGDFKDWSDIDLVIVTERLPSDPMERLDFLYSFSEGHIEPKGFTMQEFMCLLNTPFGRLLKEEGAIMIDDFEIFRRE
jgi:predicted nucleotidyltransferase